MTPSNFVQMFDADKLDYRMRMVKKIWQYVKPFLSNTGTLRTERQTDRQTDEQTELLCQYRASLCWRAIKIYSWSQIIFQIKRRVLRGKTYKRTSYLDTWDISSQSTTNILILIVVRTYPRRCVWPMSRQSRARWSRGLASPRRRKPRAAKPRII